MHKQLILGVVVFMLVVFVNFSTGTEVEAAKSKVKPVVTPTVTPVQITPIPICLDGGYGCDDGTM